MPVRQLSDGDTDGACLGQSNTDKLSFHGVTPVVRATVTGSKGANAALTSLIAVLVAKGLILDGTS